MDATIREDIKQNLKASSYKYVSKFRYTTIHPLDLLIPKERKVRSVIGGLETSIGTTVWEPIAKTLAKHNGFEVLDQKILKPDPMPLELAMELARLISLRETKATWISAEECKQRLRAICATVSATVNSYAPPPAGTGVDILLKKDGKLFAFDTKTVQPNVGSVKSFNKQLLEWYAYSICQDPDVNISCMIAYPYNPHSGNFWSYTPHTLGVLKPGEDALVENEFWNFVSGVNDTYQEITRILTELNDEGFGEELSKIIEQINNPLE